MSDQSSNPSVSNPSGSNHWLDNPATPKRLWTVFAVILGVLVVAEFFVTHSHGGLIGTTGFHAVYGLAVGLISIAIAKGWKFVMKRKDTYYDE